MMEGEGGQEQGAGVGAGLESRLDEVGADLLARGVIQGGGKGGGD